MKSYALKEWAINKNKVFEKAGQALTKTSDIDLLIVYDGTERDDAYALCKKTLGIPRLEPHVYSEKEYGEMKPPIGRMIKGGVMLFDQSEQ